MKCRFELREHQKAAEEVFASAMRLGQVKACLVQPTGTGKTISIGAMTAHSIRTGYKQIFILYHSKILQIQGFEDFQKEWTQDDGRRLAPHTQGEIYHLTADNNSQITFLCWHSFCDLVQTGCKPDVIFMDEVHKGGSNSTPNNPTQRDRVITSILAEDCHQVFVTATPENLIGDLKKLPEFKHICDDKFKHSFIDIGAAMRLGYLHQAESVYLHPELDAKAILEETGEERHIRGLITSGDSEFIDEIQSLIKNNNVSILYPRAHYELATAQIRGVLDAFLRSRNQMKKLPPTIIFCKYVSYPDIKELLQQEDLRMSTDNKRQARELSKQLKDYCYSIFHVADVLKSLLGEDLQQTSTQPHVAVGMAFSAGGSKRPRQMENPYEPLRNLGAPEVIEKFRDGVFNILLVQGMCREGFNYPALKYIIDFNSMGSSVDRIQKIGRILRPHESKPANSPAIYYSTCLAEDYINLRPPGVVARKNQSAVRSALGGEGDPVITSFDVDMDGDSNPTETDDAPGSSEPEKDCDQSGNNNPAAAGHHSPKRVKFFSSCLDLRNISATVEGKNAKRSSITDLVNKETRRAVSKYYTPPPKKKDRANVK